MAFFNDKEFAKEASKKLIIGTGLGILIGRGIVHTGAEIYDKVTDKMNERNGEEEEEE